MLAEVHGETNVALGAFIKLVLNLARGVLLEQAEDCIALVFFVRITE